MKRGILGAVLLAVLLLAGIFTTPYLNRGFDSMEQTLHLAAQSAAEEDWFRAREQAQQLRLLWEHQRSRAAVFSDHAPLEQIDLLLSRLEVWSREEAGDLCADLCAQLARELDALKQSHALTWENLL